MFFGRTLNREEIDRLGEERRDADRRYNEALTALDRAVPPVGDLPHPPPGYDEHQITPINQRWNILADPPVAQFSGWRRRLASFVWALVAPVLERQQTFNAALVDHINRNVSVHRATRQSIESTLAMVGSQLEALREFHTRLILYLQSITLYVDTKDRGEALALIVHGLSSGVDGVSAELQKRWESMVAREQRYVAAVDELRTSIAGVQQTGFTLKRELERLLAGPAALPQPGAHAATPAVSSSVSVPTGTLPAPPASAVSDSVNAYKYVGFENKFRGSQADIRERQRGYVKLFEGASDVLDLGCGRGEFLALLAEHGVRAHGLDINHEMVEVCRAQGLDVREGDGMAYLNSLPDGSLGGLMAAQVVEHFPPPYLLRFLDTAYHKLRPGSRMALETLNPACWVAFFEAYIRDITHAWPLHPDTLKYLVLASGFQRVDVRWLSPYPADAKLQSCRLPPAATTLGLVNLAQTFNENVEKLNAAMFSYTDYAIIGERL